ncbi:MAG: hypothetical protein K0S33_3780 [Bacteroidetes bacterium]|jgi:hypothetical protein|nr:hypothetical protein [Bacteroidota bacterium]
MKILLCLYTVLFLYACGEKDQQAASVKTPAKPIVPVYLPEDSMRSLIAWHTKNVLAEKDSGDIRIVTYRDQVNAPAFVFDEIIPGYEDTPADTISWSGTPVYTLTKRLYMDRLLGIVLKREIADTLLSYYIPVMEEGDSSVKVENGVKGGAEVEHFVFNTEPVFGYREPFGIKNAKLIPPETKLVANCTMECRDDTGEMLVYFVHIRDKKRPQGYWVMEKSGLFSHEMAEGAYWSNYHATLYLRKK